MIDQHNDTRPIERPAAGDHDVTAETPMLDPSTYRPAARTGRPGRTRRTLGTIAGITAGVVALGAAVALAGPQLSRSVDIDTTATPVTTSAPVQQAPATTAAPVAKSAAPVAPATPSVELAGKGFTVLAPEPDGDRDVTYAAVLRNRSADRVAVGVTARITFTGRGGAVLDVKDEQLDALLPGQTGAVADDTGLGGVTGMRVQVIVAQWAPAQGLTGRISATGVRTTRIAGELTTMATLRSTLGRDLSGADAVAVWTDRSGRILGGHSDSVDFLPAGGTAPVRIGTGHTPAGIARTQVYASPEDLFGTGD
jgi:hypothetical protein